MVIENRCTAYTTSLYALWGSIAQTTNIASFIVLVRTLWQWMRTTQLLMRRSSASLMAPPSSRRA